ncbi:hypothetical protein BC936DRAFT_146019 [Jimgerdemannia flammicorona]|uniref:Uncharacterized protein n=1 Tax=Jimgerdemannia flammicorona TaxID=994334 RepID=A0A433D9A6_9FUNG|nr:hypothetical protein BC936DRAFT_146019 [Jimgerdemannia flammicorona]
MLSTSAWLPQWTPHSLAGNHFFYFRSGQGDDSKAWLPTDRQLVEKIEDSKFVVVDDDFQPTSKAYRDILERARELRIPVLTRSGIEAADRVFRASKETREVTSNLNSPEIVNVDEDQDDKERFRLTFAEHTIDAIGVNKKATEYLHHQILLRDPIVREFADKTSTINGRHSRVKIDQDPPRIAGTRWKLDDVLSDYLAEAYSFVNRRTCIRNWNEDEFNDDYGTSYDEDDFQPADAVFTALKPSRNF